MKALVLDLLSSSWAHALGWTLLHSLWQAFAVFVLVKISLRFIPAMRANLRYALISAGFFLLIAISAITLAHFVAGGGQAVVPMDAVYTMPSPVIVQAGNEQVLNVVPTATSFVEQHIPLVVSVWFAGFVIFSLRFAAGVVYTQKIKATAITLENEWVGYVASAARKLGIRRLIRLAESAAISTPMVIGYLKPVILMPVGILTGLSTAQIETIFLHELAHIRRHDFAVNLMQSAVEAFFFFNPFVWVLSGMMRKEREYCCDDLVVREHGEAKGYAQALAQLAEVRLSKPVFALAVAGDKHQLLNRIRRIMEKSMKPYSGRSGKLAPALLLVSALFCMSWLGTRHNQSVYDAPSSVQDTIHPKKENTARLSRKRIITLDENGQPHEEIVEAFEGDEDLRPLLEKRLAPGPLMPPPPIGAVPGHRLADTIPPVPFGLHNPEQWEAFAEAFGENFDINFDDFAFGGNDPMAWMKAFQERFNGDAQWPDSSFQFDLHPHAFSGQHHFDSLALNDFNRQFQRLHELQMEHFKNFDFNFNPQAGAWPQHEKTLREHLIEDGYLSENERIESMQWSDNNVRINGKSIRKADREKYRKLYDAFMNGSL